MAVTTTIRRAGRSRPGIATVAVLSFLRAWCALVFALTLTASE
jgi:ABC-type glycerol-3-phosphate transport system permease component